LIKRSDLMLETVPIEGVVFPSSGILENLGNKTREMGIPVWKFGMEGALAPSFPSWLLQAFAEIGD
jgi:hypothetical protein